MMTVSVEEAIQQFAELLDEAAEGEEIVIVRDDGETFRLVAIDTHDDVQYDDDEDDDYDPKEDDDKIDDDYN